MQKLPSRNSNLNAVQSMSSSAPRPKNRPELQLKGWRAGPAQPVDLSLRASSPWSCSTCPTRTVSWIVARRDGDRRFRPPDCARRSAAWTLPCTPRPDREAREWVPLVRVCTPCGACVVTVAGYWITVMAPQADECSYRRVQSTPGPDSSDRTSTTVTGFTNRDSSTDGSKAPAIETGIADAEDCDYSCEQEVLEARDGHDRGETSEEEQQDEVCTAITWQTGHPCRE